MIIMLICFITIIGILLIVWFQYPYIQKEDNQYKYIYNHVKIPLIVLSIVGLIYIASCSNNKPNLDIDLAPINF